MMSGATAFSRSRADRGRFPHAVWQTSPKGSRNVVIGCFQRTISEHGPAPEGGRRHGSRDSGDPCTAPGAGGNPATSPALHHPLVSARAGELADLHGQQASLLFTSGYVLEQNRQISTIAKADSELPESCRMR